MVLIVVGIKNIVRTYANNVNTKVQYKIKAIYDYIVVYFNYYKKVI